MIKVTNMIGIIALSTAKAHILVLHHNGILFNLLQIIQHFSFTLTIGTIETTVIQVLLETFQTTKGPETFAADMLNDFLCPLA